MQGSALPRNLRAQGVTCALCSSHSDALGFGLGIAFGCRVCPGVCLQGRPQALQGRPTKAKTQKPSNQQSEACQHTRGRWAPPQLLQPLTGKLP